MKRKPSKEIVNFCKNNQDITELNFDSFEQINLADIDVLSCFIKKNNNLKIINISKIKLNSFNGWKDLADSVKNSSIKEIKISYNHYFDINILRDLFSNIEFIYVNYSKKNLKFIEECIESLTNNLNFKAVYVFQNKKYYMLKPNKIVFSSVMDKDLLYTNRFKSNFSHRENINQTNKKKFIEIIAEDPQHHLNKRQNRYNPYGR